MLALRNAGRVDELGVGGWVRREMSMGVCCMGGGARASMSGSAASGGDKVEWRGRSL